MLEILALVVFSQQPLMPVADGIASYYTVKGNGTETASGVPFNDADYTCAMLKGQLGAKVLVAADTGKTVVCRVTDRGPHVKGRVVDLSQAAMRALHPAAGTLHVKVFKVANDTPVGPEA
jgi:rare lipoprotein A